MPALAALLDSGTRLELDTPAALYPAAVYPTLYSGTGVAEHGLFYPFQWVAGEQRIRVADALPHPTTLWEELARSGRRALVVDPYELLPPGGPTSGVIVSGWQVAERVVLRRWSRPRRAWADLARRHRRPPSATETFGPQSEGRLEALRASLVDAPARVVEAGRQLLGSGSFDLAWFTFVAAHLGGHRLWDRPALDDVYRATDEALGELLDLLGDSARPIVICPLGMERNMSCADLLPEMLTRILGEGAEGVGGADSGSMWRLRAALPAGLRSGVAKALPAAAARSLTARLELRGMDWSQTRAFAHPSDNQGYVRFNLRGRELRGIVPPEEADELAEQISAGLAGFADSEGRAVVEAAVRADGGAEGARRDELPDLIVRWGSSLAASEGAVHSPSLGTVARHGSGSGRGGNHPDGGAWALVPGEAALGLSGPRIGLAELAPALLGAARDG